MDVLRDASVNISTDEVLSLFNALPHISLTDKPVFRQALKTTLVKDYTDIPVFDRCFDEFFCGSGDAQVDIVNAFRDMAARDTVRERTGMNREEADATGTGLCRIHRRTAGRHPFRTVTGRDPEPVSGRARHRRNRPAGWARCCFNVRNRNRQATGRGAADGEGEDDKGLTELMNAIMIQGGQTALLEKIGTSISDPRGLPPPQADLPDHARRDQGDAGADQAVRPEA